MLVYHGFCYVCHYDWYHIYHSHVETIINCSPETQISFCFVMRSLPIHEPLQRIYMHWSKQSALNSSWRWLTHCYELKLFYIPLSCVRYLLLCQVTLPSPYQWITPWVCDSEMFTVRHWVKKTTDTHFKIYYIKAKNNLCVTLIVYIHKTKMHNINICITPTV